MIKFKIMLLLSFLCFNVYAQSPNYGNVQMDTFCAPSDIIRGKLVGYTEQFNGLDENRATTKNNIRVFINTNISRFMVIMDIREYNTMCILSSGNEYKHALSNYKLL